MYRNVDSIITEVFKLYELHGGDDYIGEPVSQLEHMVQAGELAFQEGYDDEVVLAAFFHDIGHLIDEDQSLASMDGYGVVDHESVGAQYLIDRGFSERIAILVKSHVEAKRYLTFRRPEYLAKLSEASQKTLMFQGGMMNEEEALAFEQDPFFDLKVKMRLWDDEAKLTDITLRDLNFFKELAKNHLSKQN
jgi:phosphonate degradation associated HDIG domain protein